LIIAVIFNRINYFGLKRRITFFFLVTLSTFAYSQKNIRSIKFNPVCNSAPVELGKKYAYKTDSIEISALKFYISNIRFYQHTELVDEVIKKYHLVDIENAQSLTVNHSNKKNKKFNRLVFCIGVDSITNVSGALGGDLDPTNGMYWTWQSGYINFKLEGISKICPSRKNQFIFHIGGYQYPYTTIQQIDLPISNPQKIIVEINILQLLNQWKLDESYEVMSPNAKAVEMAKKIKKIFSTGK
jgi:hypothetical protein